MADEQTREHQAGAPASETDDQQAAGGAPAHEGARDPATPPQQEPAAGAPQGGDGGSSDDVDEQWLALREELTAEADDDEPPRPPKPQEQAKSTPPAQGQDGTAQPPATPPESGEAQNQQQDGQQQTGDGEQQADEPDEPDLDDAIERAPTSQRKRMRKLLTQRNAARDERNALRSQVADTGRALTVLSDICQRTGLKPEHAPQAVHLMGAAMSGDPQAVQYLAQIAIDRGWQPPAPPAAEPPKPAVDPQALATAIRKAREDFDFEALDALATKLQQAPPAPPANQQQPPQASTPPQAPQQQPAPQGQPQAPHAQAAATVRGMMAKVREMHGDAVAQAVIEQAKQFDREPPDQWPTRLMEIVGRVTAQGARPPATPPATPPAKPPPSPPPALPPSPPQPRHQAGRAPDPDREWAQLRRELTAGS